MLWTTFSAAEFAIHRWLFRAAMLRSDEHLSFHVLGITSSIVTGAAYTGLLVLVREYRRGCSSIMRQPGHWLLAFSAAGDLLLELIRLLWTIGLTRGGTAATVRITLLSTAGVYVLVGLGLLAAMWSAVRVPRWKMLFAAAATAEFVVAFSYGSIDRSALGTWPYFLFCGHLPLAVTALAMLAVSAWEQAKGGSRDWLHWMGVIVFSGVAWVSLVWVSG